MPIMGHSLQEVPSVMPCSSFVAVLHFSWAGWDVLMPGINEEYGVYILPYLALP